MEKVTFFESIGKIFKTVFSIPFFIEIFVLTIILIGVLSFFSIKNSKRGRITSLIIYIVCLLLLPISHFSFFVTTFDTIIGNYIEILYFPSCYVYIAILIITDIDVLRILIKNRKKKNKVVSNILNIIYFGLMQFFFFVSIRIVLDKKINIFERGELYSDSNLVSFIQICSYLFWIRIVILLVIKIVDVLTNYKFKKITVIEEDIVEQPVKEKKFKKEETIKEKARLKEKKEPEKDKSKKPKLIDFFPDNEEKPATLNKDKDNKKIFYNFEINETVNNPINNMKPITLITESNNIIKNDKSNNAYKEENKKINTDTNNNDENEKFFDDFYD